MYPRYYPSDCGHRYKVTTPTGQAPTQPPGPPIDSAVKGVRRTRISRAWTAVAVMVVLGVALIAFLVQNTRSVHIKFFGASGHIPIAVALLAAALIGALIVLGVGIARTTQLRVAARRQASTDSTIPAERSATARLSGLDAESTTAPQIRTSGPDSEP
jgi:lipopolysaccharide assembly protein A